MIIDSRMAAELATNADDETDVARAIMRAEGRDKGSWLPFDAEAWAAFLGCSLATAEAIFTATGLRPVAP